jgi:alkylhydroperoxidase family enzyme
VLSTTTSWPLGGTDAVTPYWKTIAHHPPTLHQTWNQFKATMAAGALDPLTKEMLYLAVSVTNRCNYCIEARQLQGRRNLPP